MVLLNLKNNKLKDQY